MHNDNIDNEDYVSDIVFNVSWLQTGTDAFDEYLDDLSDAYAKRISEKVIKKVNDLDLFPFKGRPGRETGTRELVIEDVIVVYEIHGTDVHVVFVKSTNQQ